MPSTLSQIRIITRPEKWLDTWKQNAFETNYLLKIFLKAKTVTDTVMLQHQIIPVNVLRDALLLNELLSASSNVYTSL